MSKEKFLEIFDLAKEQITVEVTVPGCPEPETITNNWPNFMAKRDYYARAYNDNLELISNPEIKIVGYRYI
jgi:hypothetical protein